MEENQHPPPGSCNDEPSWSNAGDYIGNASLDAERLILPSASQAPLKAESPPLLPPNVRITIALRRFWRWFRTPMGCFITVYMLNIVAWGGMLFLLLCNAAPAMCHPTCNDINSPRQIWLEIDSQILNALFCVTGFGLAPYRFRDLYWWIIWRFSRTVDGRSTGIRRLAGIHRDWFRLPLVAGPSSEGRVEELVSQGAILAKDGAEASSLATLATANAPEPAAIPLAQSALPIPASRASAPPLTGVRAPPTKPWKMTLVIHCMVGNTLFQCCLAGCMWGLNRYNRPGWTTGLFIALACLLAGFAGWMIMAEGNRIKKIEGAAISEEEQLARSKLGLSAGTPYV